MVMAADTPHGVQPQRYPSGHRHVGPLARVCVWLGAVHLGAYTELTYAGRTQKPHRRFLWLSYPLPSFLVLLHLRLRVRGG